MQLHLILRGSASVNGLDLFNFDLIANTITEQVCLETLVSPWSLLQCKHVCLCFSPRVTSSKEIRDLLNQFLINLMGGTSHLMGGTGHGK